MLQSPPVRRALSSKLKTLKRVNECLNSLPLGEVQTVLKLKIQKDEHQVQGGLLGLKDFKYSTRVTAASGYILVAVKYNLRAAGVILMLKLLSDYYYWKEYADKEEIKD
ncbi:hypothetical protein Tco_0201043 [Tanacetum coccineum]